MPKTSTRCDKCFLEKPLNKIRKCCHCKKDVCFSCSTEESGRVFCHHCLENEKDSPMKKSPLKKKKK